MKYLVETYQERLNETKVRELDIKWDRDLVQYLNRKIQKSFQEKAIVRSLYRPYKKQYLYFDRHFNSRTFQLPSIFHDGEKDNVVILCTDAGSQKPFMTIASNIVPDLHIVGAACGSQCLPLYRYDENGNRIDNITDWGLTQFQTYYNDSTITKEAIFHYTYAVLHHPTYRSKYELNLKREFPRLPFYPDFQQWAAWGKELMDLHLNYETIEPYPLRRIEKDSARAKSKASVQESLLPTAAPDSSKPTKRTVPKAKLKAEKTEGKIFVDTATTLEGVPAIAWEYKLGNRCALEWILDQYKEKKPKDPTIAKLFNTYKFADYKESVIDLLQRVCTVSIKTIEILRQMPAE